MENYDLDMLTKYLMRSFRKRSFSDDEAKIAMAI